jgi:hypothetical protein
LKEGVMLEPYGREQQAIRERAYAIWQQEGCPDDRTLSNWLQAEAEIKGEEVFGPNIRKKVSDRHREIGRGGRGVIPSGVIVP